MSNVIEIFAYADRKLSKKTVDIGNMQESGVTRLKFSLEEDIQALGGNVYLIASYDGESYPYPLREGEIEIGREFTQRVKTPVNLIVSTSKDINNPLNGVVWISNTLTLVVDKNSINVDAINEQELPPSLKIIYDNLLNLEKELKEKMESGYWKGDKGDKGDAGGLTCIPCKELPTTDIIPNVYYLLENGTEEIEVKGETVVKNKYVEYMYINGEWEIIGSISIGMNLDEYVKNTDYANGKTHGLVRFDAYYGITGGSAGSAGVPIPVWATKDNIDNRSGNCFLKPSMFDYAVKKALSDCKLSGDDVWTDEEKASALELLGGLARKKSVVGTYLYGETTNGSTTYQLVNNAAKAWSVPHRDSTGAIYTGEPTNDGHAATKKYVDDLFKSINGNEVAY